MCIRIRTILLFTLFLLSSFFRSFSSSSSKYAGSGAENSTYSPVRGWIKPKTPACRVCPSSENGCRAGPYTSSPETDDRYLPYGRGSVIVRPVSRTALDKCIRPEAFQYAVMRDRIAPLFGVDAHFLAIRRMTPRSVHGRVPSSSRRLPNTMA